MAEWPGICRGLKYQVANPLRRLRSCLSHSVNMIIPGVFDFDQQRKLSAIRSAVRNCWKCTLSSNNDDAWNRSCVLTRLCPCRWGNCQLVGKLNCPKSKDTGSARWWPIPRMGYEWLSLYQKLPGQYRFTEALARWDERWPMIIHHVTPTRCKLHHMYHLTPSYLVQSGSRPVRYHYYMRFDAVNAQSQGIHYKSHCFSSINSNVAIANHMRSLPKKG